MFIFRTKQADFISGPFPNVSSEKEKKNKVIIIIINNQTERTR